MTILFMILQKTNTYISHSHVQHITTVQKLTALANDEQYTSNEPRHEQTCRRDFWPGKTQTGRLCYRDKLEAQNFGYRN